MLRFESMYTCVNCLLRSLRGQKKGREIDIDMVLGDDATGQVLGSGSAVPHPETRILSRDPSGGVRAATEVDRHPATPTKS